MPTELKKTVRYPVLSAKSASLLLGIVAALIAILVFTLGHKSVFKELQITLSLISLILFLFLAIGLYKGVRLKKEKRPESKWQPGNLDFLDAANASPIDFLDVFGGIAEFLFSIVSWIVVSIIILALLWLLAETLWPVFVILGAELFWIFYRALRQVFVKSRACKGRILPSLGYSLLYTLLYTGWIFGLTWLARYLMIKF